MRLIVFSIVAMTLALFIGFFTAQLPPAKMIWGGVFLAIFALSFMNIEFGLYILIFSMLLSPEIVIGETAGSSLSRGLTLRLEDFLLVETLSINILCGVVVCETNDNSFEPVEC